MVGVEGPGAPAPLGIELSDPAPATAITPTLPSDHVLWSLVGEFLHADVLRVDRTLATMVDAPGIISEVAWKAMCVDIGAYRDMCSDDGADIEPDPWHQAYRQLLVPFARAVQSGDWLEVRRCAGYVDVVHHRELVHALALPSLGTRLEVIPGAWRASYAPTRPPGAPHPALPTHGPWRRRRPERGAARARDARSRVPGTYTVRSCAPRTSKATTCRCTHIHHALARHCIRYRRRVPSIVVIQAASRAAGNIHVLRDLGRLYVKDLHVLQALCPPNLRVLRHDCWIIKIDTSTVVRWLHASDLSDGNVSS